MKKRLMALSVLSAICFFSQSHAAPKTFVYCSEGSPEGFDPGMYTAGTTFDASAHPIYSRLMEFKPGTNRKTLALDGTETYDVVGKREPRADLTLVIHRQNGQTDRVATTCRLDTAEEVSVYEAGGVLQRFAQDFLASNRA